MIPIDNKQLRRAVDLAPLEASNKAIAELNDAERDGFMKDHEPECSAVRGGLWTVGHMKCWYSEAQLQECEGQVEHYRPKKRPSGTDHDGYWWKAFDWTNLRLAHPTVNRRKTDYLSGKPAGKGGYFPLRDEATRALGPGQEDGEEPVLLDPVVPADTRLLCFDEASGGPRPRFGKAEDQWAYRRAEESIDYYHLNEVTWNARRADLMASVRKLCEEIEALDSGSLEYDKKVNEIFQYVGPYAEFSSACRQVLSSRGLLEIVAPPSD